MIIKKEDYLAHYGVLGMKWRQKKANRLLLKAKNARESEKEWQAIKKAQSSKYSKNSKRLKTYDKYTSDDNRDAKKYERKVKALISSINKKQEARNALKKAKATYKKANKAKTDYKCAKKKYKSIK